MKDIASATLKAPLTQYNRRQVGLGDFIDDPAIAGQVVHQAQQLYVRVGVGRNSQEILTDLQCSQLLHHLSWRQTGRKI